MGSKIIMGFDPSTLRIYDLEEGEVSGPSKSAADMMGDLRRKNSGATGPSQKQDQPPADPVRSIATLKELTAMIRR